MTRVAIQPALFVWARERARMDEAALEARFPNLPEWESGAVAPTLRQLEQYARATHAPLGYFFLPEPPQESVPIPDFRTIGPGRPQISADLLDSIYSCQNRQAWYRDEALVNGETPLSFVGSVTRTTTPADAADLIRHQLGFSVPAQSECASWTEALRMFVSQAERAGVMVMVSGVVMNDNHRQLDPRELRGFALADAMAPLVFINGADSKAAQMFTLAHELAQLWLGQSAVSDARMDEASSHATEIWCNQAAAELLAPQGELDVAAHDTGAGDFYRTTLDRVSRRFARALVASTLEGRTLYRDAFRMLGISTIRTFDELARILGFRQPLAS